MSEPRDGVIYVATGDDYRDLAFASLRSLRRHNPDLSVDLFTDRLDFEGADLFDRVHLVPRVHPRAKLDCMPLSRFERTLYLDSDTLIIAPFADLFDLMDRFELALAHDVRRASSLVQQGAGVATPYAFPQLNSGVVLYRKSDKTETFFAEWLDRYANSGLKRDQPALKDILWSSDIRFYVLPPEFNLRRVTMLDAWEPQDARPTIIHSHRLLDHLLEARGARCQDLPTLLVREREALDDEWSRIGATEADRQDLSVLLDGISKGLISPKALPETDRDTSRSRERAAYERYHRRQMCA
ncbi:Lipopolysaccharide biosynthesis protein, LPS:glycosyltransferase [Tranquillimonas rosea]|uniref:Lipopolysaccharide biosynthesis protein, LPS:glycosyltransferase n=1 Tax=Tranquillimonas rosea TaxID=641238 RepID=A0A1H9W222_9RHOB|nr:putative nucleotide-diphospho-sugar transferase [Tranquillimonas rosea]SES27829.1 Lipopolysaccharide biosynthesis protein, LPS:glycosyltransferase [Tranquillimonas rosea]